MNIIKNTFNGGFHRRRADHHARARRAARAGLPRVGGCEDARAMVGPRGLHQPGVRDRPAPRRRHPHPHARALRHGVPDDGEFREIVEPERLSFATWAHGEDGGKPGVRGVKHRDIRGPRRAHETHARGETLRSHARRGAIPSPAWKKAGARASTARRPRYRRLKKMPLSGAMGRLPAISGDDESPPARHLFATRHVRGRAAPISATRPRRSRPATARRRGPGKRTPPG